MKYNYDVCIIGGGAAGMAAAASLDRNLNICIIEKNKILGRKVLATGGGRCNITNTACQGYEQTLGFFASLGLEIYEDEEGRCYPYTNRASDVVEILSRQIKADIMCEETALELAGSLGNFRIRTNNRQISAKAVIIAAGGKAAPQFGTAGDGYRLAGQLGHTIDRTYPILTGVECSDNNGNRDFLKKLKGIRAKAAVSLLKNGKPVLGENDIPVFEMGELQFTEYGISGICVFNLTPYIKAEDGENFREALNSFQISVDLAPDLEQDKINDRTDSFGIVTAALAEVVKVSQLKDWRLQVTGVRGWKEAQCTAGGIRLEEINEETMESQLAQGLYLAGEILNIQGPCGGYNLQNAWETGIRAAEAVNEVLAK